jgi:hypothetical protein
LAISRQPFVLYQDLVLYNVLQERVGLLHFETVGAAADPNESIAVHLDNLARCLYELRHHKQLLSRLAITFTNGPETSALRGNQTIAKRLALQKPDTRHEIRQPEYRQRNPHL